MKVLKKAAAVTLTLGMMLSLTAIPTSAKATPKLNKTSALLVEGKSVTLKVTGAKKVTWKSSAKSVATVTSKGKVTAKKAGTATISAKVAKKTLKCTVYVTEKAEQAVIDVPSPDWVKNLPEAQTATQIVVVAAENETDRAAWFTFHQKKADGTWHMKITTPCFIGKNGLGKTKGGDLKTPVGTYTFTDAFGNADDPGCKMPYFKATEYTRWNDCDPSAMYNQLIKDIRDYPDLNFDECEENIAKTPVHYQYCLNISYNKEGDPTKGSAIFLHCFGVGKPWTGGCVAIPVNRMKYLMTQVDENTQVVINTQANLGAEWPDNELYYPD